LGHTAAEHLRRIEVYATRHEGPNTESPHTRTSILLTADLGASITGRRTPLVHQSTDVGAFSAWIPFDGAKRSAMPTPMLYAVRNSRYRTHTGARNIIAHTGAAFDERKERIHAVTLWA
jgi:hypothetical protein